MSQIPSKPQTSPRRPRLFRFSLRMLLIGITVLCVWLAVRAHRAGQERDAREALSPLARNIEYDFDGPAWLRELIGDEYFSRIRVIRFASETNDDDLAGVKDQLEVLGCLRTIDLATCRGITDRGLAQLGSLSRVRSLDLRKTSVTNSGVALLSNLRELERLQLGTISTIRVAAGLVNDDGLKHVSAIRGLNSLDLWGEAFTDAGLKHLEGLDLRHLWFQKARVSDRGLQHLRHLENLEVLAFEYCDVSDVGIRQLTSLRNLKRLYLDGTRVSDQGLQHIAVLPKLEKVSLQQTKVTAKGRARLRSLMPNCKVE